MAAELQEPAKTSRYEAFDAQLAYLWVYNTYRFLTSVCTYVCMYAWMPVRSHVGLYGFTKPEYTLVMTCLIRLQGVIRHLVKPQTPIPRSQSCRSLSGCLCCSDVAAPEVGPVKSLAPRPHFPDVFKLRQAGTAKGAQPKCEAEWLGRVRVSVHVSWREAESISLAELW